MDRKRRYNSGVAALCGSLGLFVLPMLTSGAGFRDDRLLSVLAIVGLCGGWALGASYIYRLFYYENGTPTPHTLRLRKVVGMRGERLCAEGRHNWNGFPSMCKRCGRHQFPGQDPASKST
jgi:hypothetical protein